MRRPYIHQQPDWPNLRWRDADLLGLLAAVRHQQGRLLGRVEALGFAVRDDLSLSALTNEVVKSSEIEGEMLDLEQVRSSIAQRLGIDDGSSKNPPGNVAGIVDLMLDATLNYEQPLTADRLFQWQQGLFPGGRSGLQRITIGDWRNDATGPMQVISGPIGREKVHFEAPPAPNLAQEMATFLDWCNAPPQTDPVLKAGQAHLWFVTIHPFDDGNGRIARAIADLLLARADGAPQRFYSMSSQIMQEREDYYSALETAQKGSTDITLWLKWFLHCLARAIADTQQKVDAALAKAQYWGRLNGLPGLALNARQRRLINTLFDGFHGKFTADKWAKIAKCSVDAAQHDIDYLIANDVLELDPAPGPRPNYLLVGDRRVPRQMRQPPP